MPAARNRTTVVAHTSCNHDERFRMFTSRIRRAATPASASTLYYEWESEKSQFNP
jgi:hypothetical protein